MITEFEGQEVNYFGVHIIDSIVFWGEGEHFAKAKAVRECFWSECTRLYISCTCIYICIPSFRANTCGMRICV